MAGLELASPELSNLVGETSWGHLLQDGGITKSQRRRRARLGRLCISSSCIFSSTNWFCFWWKLEDGGSERHWRKLGHSWVSHSTLVPFFFFRCTKFLPLLVWIFLSLCLKSFPNIWRSLFLFLIYLGLCSERSLHWPFQSISLCIPSCYPLLFFFLGLDSWHCVKCLLIHLFAICSADHFYEAKTLSHSLLCGQLE